MGSDVGGTSAGDLISISEAETPIFDEHAYLAAFPKIAEKVRNGQIRSGHDHYVRSGLAEGRLNAPRYRKALTEQALLARLSGPRPAIANAAAAVPRGHIASGLDAVVVSEGGYCFVIGWVDDRGLDFSIVSIELADGRTAHTASIARCRRPDAETAIGCPPGHLLGFYAFIDLQQQQPPGPGTNIVLRCGADVITHVAFPNLMRPEGLRDVIFEYIAAATYFGSPTVESFLQLQCGIGLPLLDLNAAISAGITRLAHVERYGPTGRDFVASIVVCLYGKPEYLFLQAALFSAARGAADYEFIYVSNSPELTESLQREARIAAQLYGLSLTLVFLPGNAGFGAANNIAVGYAQSDRVLIVNPDVFPRDSGWAERHTAIIDGLPAEQTRIFGAPLFYDDGSLMHGGMFIETDIGLSVKPDSIIKQELLRVEHYGKGSPPGTELYLSSRRVPAVTGAFISTDRLWFERLGGFSEQYVFGHYEDADLCLKSWREGGEVWMHDMPMWHLEGKGSTRRAAHEGGSIINRWHFTRTWAEMVRNGFAGSAPERIAQ